MSKKKQDVFEQLQESLKAVYDQLSDANAALYIVATSVIDLGEKLDTFIAKIDAITVKATEEPIEQPEKPEVPKPEVPTFSFKELKKEMK